MDHFLEAQRAAEKRLAYCSILLYEEEDVSPSEVSKPIAPYCGCDTCVVREVLDAAWPHLLDAFRGDVFPEE